MIAPDATDFEYIRCPEQDGATTNYPVVAIGAGPVGLAAAIDLQRHGIPVILLDGKTSLSDGSRAFRNAVVELAQDH